MALSFHQSVIPYSPLHKGINEQVLLDRNTVPDIKVTVSRISLHPGASWSIRASSNEIVWFQVLSGTVVIEDDEKTSELNSHHVVLFPPLATGVIQSGNGATLLYATVPDYKLIDPECFFSEPSLIRILDWSKEPVLQSEHDARKRIYLVTPTLSGTTAIKGEMIIYPPGTEAANHHHEGAAHFMYILAGKGTCYANEQPFAVTEGDVVYYEDMERHYLQSDPKTEMRFVEFFVPGKYKTIWAPDANVCAWLPTGKNILGKKAARHIQAHSSAAPTPDI